MSDEREHLLAVDGLATHFKTRQGIVRAVNGVSFALDAGDTLGVVGESGCGKSVTGLSIMRLVQFPPGRIVSGEVLFQGRRLLYLKEVEMRRVRGGQIAMIFQDPMTSLNPVLTIGRQMTEALELHLGMSGAAARQRCVELLDLVGIPAAAARLGDYPHHFSGGMRQRVMIAMALSCSPRLLIADEPTTALDVTIQAQILDLMRKLCRETHTAVMLITHNLGVVAGFCRRTQVMYAGRIVESALTRDLFREPHHPYTLGLLKSIPRLDEEGRTRLRPIRGQPPNLAEQPGGCPFAPRCDYALDRCWREDPQLRPVGQEHAVACWAEVRVTTNAAGVPG